MAMTTGKVGPNYKPTAMVVKANPTVKKFTPGQTINIPYNPPIPVTPPLQTRDALERGPIASVLPSSSLWLPASGSSSSVTKPPATSSTVNSQSILDAYYFDMMRSKGYTVTTPTTGTVVKYGSGGTDTGGGNTGGNFYREGGGENLGGALTGLEGDPFNAGNDVNQGMNWRVG